jgi:primosomal protein N' (replication factor Y)
MALVRIDAIDERAARRAGERLAADARALEPVRAGRVEVVGPAPAPIERIRGRYRFRLLVRSAQRPHLRAVLARLVAASRELPGPVRAIVDVDPVSML